MPALGAEGPVLLPKTIGRSVLTEPLSASSGAATAASTKPNGSMSDLPHCALAKERASAELPELGE
jgi:hypothetical protein